MKHITTCKAIRMNDDTMRALMSAITLLRTLDDELEAISKEDDYYSDLEVNCFAAECALEDFINLYNDYAKGEG